jgi:hypothetical protein
MLCGEDFFLPLSIAPLEGELSKFSVDLSQFHEVFSAPLGWNLFPKQFDTQSNVATIKERTGVTVSRPAWNKRSEGLLSPLRLMQLKCGVSFCRLTVERKSEPATASRESEVLLGRPQHLVGVGRRATRAGWNDFYFVPLLLNVACASLTSAIALFFCVGVRFFPPLARTRVAMNTRCGRQI